MSQLQTFATLAEYNTAKSNRTLTCPNVSKITADGSVKFLRVNPPVGVGIKTIESGLAKYYTLEEWNALETKPAAADIVGEYVNLGDTGFVICQTKSSAMKWSSNTTYVVPNCTTTTAQATGLQDYNGLQNTLAIIAAKELGSIADCPAADWARSQFNGQGWLPSMGELDAIRNNLTDINLCRAAITAAGQTRAAIAFTNNYLWTSTQYTARYAWYWNSTSWFNISKSDTTYSCWAVSAL